MQEHQYKLILQFLLIRINVSVLMMKLLKMQLIMWIDHVSTGGTKYENYQ